jgi:hypothetical protein
MASCAAFEEPEGTAGAVNNTCPRWCVTEHGQLDGEEDHLHTSAGLRLADGVTAHLCATVDPNTGQTDGPYILVESQEWTLDHAKSVGHALIALADSDVPRGQAGPQLV